MYEKILSGYTNIMQYADPRIENYFLMKSPLPVFIITLSYLAFIFKIGPALMKNQPPMKLDGVIMVYNWVQILANASVLLVALQELPKMSLLCTPIDRSNSFSAIRMVNLQYSYTMLKILDLLDTVFFVLRKKQNQITFLHVYHHVLMCVSCWLTCKFFIGGQVYFLGLPNLLVHTVMYYYYFLTAWNAEYRNNIWWKKYITQLQIVQHCFIFAAFALPLLNPHCSYPKLLLGLYLTQTTVMIYLFVRFYVKTYTDVKKKSH